MDAFKEKVPGIGICLLMAIPCWFLGKQFPIIGGPVFAILLGILIAVFWKQDKRGDIQKGIGYTGKKILQYAVILLGFGLNLLQIAQVGLTSLPVIVSTITTSLVVAYLICKLTRADANISILIGVGSSICGGSAIAATAPVIKAKDEEIAQAISVIFLFNVIAALIFPTLGTILGLSNDGFGLFAGTAVNDTSSVTAAASAWDGMHPGSNALDYATIVKLTRTLAIIPITLVLAIWQARKAKRQAESEGKLEGFSIKKSFPMFILWFLVASLVTTAASACGVDASLFAPLKDLSKFFIIMAMAAIGLNTDVVKLVKSGGKPIFMGFCCWVAIACVSLGMQQLIGAF